MCVHYRPPSPKALQAHFQLDEVPDGGQPDLWPGYTGLFIRRHAFAEVGDEAVPAREALLGTFGLIPHWSKERGIAKRTYNARAESVADKPSFRDAWKNAQFCLVPAEAIFEPDWRSGKAVATRISRADGAPMGLAGLWARWRAPGGEIVYSYTLLTINADRHPFMRQFHRPTDEKRMLVILPEDRYGAWLRADAKAAAGFLQPFPAEALRADVPPRGERPVPDAGARD